MEDAKGHLLPARSLTRGQLIALDVLAAAGLLVLVPSFTLTSAASPAGAHTLPAWVELLLITGAAVPVAVRRLWPVPVFTVVLTMTVLSMLLGVARDPFIAASYALYVVAVSAPPRRRVPPRMLTAGVISIGLLTTATAIGGATPRESIQQLDSLGGSLGGAVTPGWVADVGAVLFGLAIMGGTWTVGRAVAERRAYAARAAEQLARQAVSAERLRIARELHDIVAHSMSLIAVKAGIANHVLAQRPEEAQDALRVIETTSRGALTEMRHLLGVLRTDTSADTAADADARAGVRADAHADGKADVEVDAAAADLRPTPGVAELPALADRAAQAGVRVRMDLRGADRLPEGVGLAAYRIVQEALTNVVKHAAPTRCQVTVSADEREVCIEVTDDGPASRRPALAAAPGRAGGHGLIGMRERVILYGGSFAAGPRPKRGFTVTARLPYQPTSSPPGSPDPAMQATPAAGARSTGGPADPPGGEGRGTRP